MRSYRNPLFTLCLSIVAFLNGCVVGPDYSGVQLKDADNPSWRTSSLGELSEESSFSSETRWWERFEDPELSRLISEVMAGNFTLAEAAARVQTAYAQRGVTNAEMLPTLDGNTSYTVAQTGSTSKSINSMPPGQSLDLFSIGFTAGWEVDLWGRVKRLVEADNANIGAALDDYRGVALALASETALAYTEIKNTEKRIEWQDKKIEWQAHSLQLSEDRYQTGNGDLLAVKTAERLLETAIADRFNLVQDKQTSENRLASLLGRFPEDSILKSETYPTLPLIHDLGLPADLILRRPDIRQAERSYAAAMARIGAAEAERWPKLSLTGSFNLQTNLPENYFNPNSLIYTLGPSLQIPLFQGGLIKRNISVRESEAEQARWQLEQALIDAVVEVDNAASGMMHSQARTHRLNAAVQAAEHTILLLEERYTRGLTNLSELIDTQLQLVDIQDTLLLAEQNTFSETITLYRSLGGGWAALDAMRNSAKDPENAHFTLSSKES